MTSIDKFYSSLNEPIQSCFLALKKIILSQDPEITNELKYGMPFFSYRGKMFCYLWYHKKYKQPYIGMVEGHLFTESYMLQEKRSRIKIMLIDANQDLPLERIKVILLKGRVN